MAFSSEFEIERQNTLLATDFNHNFSWTVLKAQKAHQQDAAPDGDGAVGDVEGGPMVAPQVKVQEVHHFAQPDSIREVADGPSQNEPQGPAGPKVPMLEAVVDVENDAHGDDVDPDEKNMAPQSGGACQDAESRSRVAHVNQVEKAGTITRTSKRGM